MCSGTSSAFRGQFRFFLQCFAAKLFSPLNNQQSQLNNEATTLQRWLTALLLSLSLSWTREAPSRCSWTSEAPSCCLSWTHSLNSQVETCCDIVVPSAVATVPIILLRLINSIAAQPCCCRCHVGRENKRETMKDCDRHSDTWIQKYRPMPSSWIETCQHLQTWKEQTVHTERGDSENNNFGNLENYTCSRVQPSDVSHKSKFF